MPLLLCTFTPHSFLRRPSPLRLNPLPRTRPPTNPRALYETNKAIKDSYIVRLTASKAGPDVHLSTTNGAIATTIHLKGTLDRAAVVDVHTSNGRVDLSVPVREVPISVKARTTNGAATITLPRDFDGLVSLRTTNGGKKLSEGMAGAVIFPNEEGDDSKTVTYRVRPRKGVERRREERGGEFNQEWEGVDKHQRREVEEEEFQRKKEREEEREEEEWSDQSNAGPDRAHISSTNGTVKAQYADEQGEEEKEGGCVVM